jgi:hypothetical protein
MSIPPIPPPLESLGSRPFSFYPAILNIEHNEWRYRKATWSEVMVVNAKSGEELWIPRRFLGEISRIDDPVVIVGLVKELEYRGGAVWPYQRRVIQMPLAVGDAPRAAPAVGNSEPAPVIGIRVESPDSRLGRLVAAALAIACGTVACIMVVAISREGFSRLRGVTVTARDESYQALGQNDDYYSVKAKLGEPAEDRWKSETGAIQFRALFYPQHSFIVILMGSERASAHYIGTLSSKWELLYSTSKDSSSLLRQLKRF